MDGTIYSGGTLFESTLPFLALMGELGIGHTFLTNNSSKSAKDYLARLNQIGIPATPDQLYTSTQATIEHLREQMPAVRRLFVLGTASMSRELEGAGFALTADSATDEPDAVLVGFDTELTFSRLCRAAYWISQGKPFVATHPDRVCPTDQPTVLVDCGAICAALEQAAGRGPDVVLGKPHPVHVAGHPEPARAGAQAARHGGRPPIHGHGYGAPGRGPGGAGADRRDHRGARGESLTAADIFLALKKVLPPDCRRDTRLVLRRVIMIT